MSRIQQGIITGEVFKYLTDLEKNNTREWFTAHKNNFKEQEATVKDFLGLLMNRLRAHDDIDKLKLFRIHRDVRFSKDKTPYKVHFAGSFSRAGLRLRGGYYIQIKPGGSFIATGFWEPNKADMLRIRKEFELDASEIRDIINDRDFREIWGDMQGETLKTAPMGFNKDHPDIDLIKRKQFIFLRNFSDEDVLAADFMEVVDRSFQKIRPYFNYMSEILTTDLNGESLYD